MKLAFTELFRYRDLLLLWILRDIRVRYQQSLLGAIWAILQPLTMTIVFTLVFSRLLRVDTRGIPYPVFAYSALVPWTFFSTGIAFGIPSLVTNMNLVTKIYFPREILPFATVGAVFVDFVIAFLIFLGMMLVYRIPLHLQALWVFPLLLIQITLMLGITLLGSAIIVFFRDMRFVIPLMTQVWMYATPIIYPIELVPEKFRTIYYLNPMVGLIDGYRNVLVHGDPPNISAVSTSAVVAIILFIIGYLFFKRTEPLFADMI